MARPDNSAAEDYLIEVGDVKHRSSQRRVLLGCMACRWNDLRTDGLEPTVYGNQIIACARLKSGLVYPLLHQLGEGQAVDAIPEDIPTSELGRPPRTYYGPADSAIGATFAAKLEPPETCPLPAELK